MTSAHLDVLPDIRELSGTQVEKWLGRRHGWARQHMAELGGYCDEGGRGRYPVHAIKRWQERQAQEYRGVA